MKNPIFIETKFGLLFFILLSACIASQAETSSYSLTLDSLRTSLQKYPSPEKEHEYLKIFPQTYPEFRKTFYGLDCLENWNCELGELYFSYVEHLVLLEELSDRYPGQVLSIWFNIAADAEWDADAISTMQIQLAEYGAKNPRKFGEELLGRAPNQQGAIIRFIVDTESHPASLTFQNLVKALNSVGFKDLSREFIVAANLRAKRKH